MSHWNALQRNLLQTWVREREARQLVEALVRMAGNRPRDLVGDSQLLLDLLSVNPEVVAFGIRNSAGWVQPPVGSMADRLEKNLPPLHAEIFESRWIWGRFPFHAGPPDGSGIRTGGGAGRGPWWMRSPEISGEPTAPSTVGTGVRPGGGPFEIAVIFARNEEDPAWGYAIQVWIWPTAWLLISGLWIWNLRVRARMEVIREEARREAHLAGVGRMTARLAHEIKNPLGAIRGAAQHLLSGFSTSDPKAALLKVVEDETRRLEDLTRGILDFSRPVQISPSPQSAGDLLKNILDRFATLRRIPAIPLILPADLPTIVCDPGALGQILENLFSNAFDADREGKVECVVLDRPEGTLVRVEDRGTGISPEVESRLFEPFLSTKNRGYGLGLVISRRLAEAHGGSLVLHNREGGGCVAELMLPRERKDVRIP